MIENVGNAQPHPDDESGQGNGIHPDYPAQAGLPQFPHIGHQTDGEEAETEEHRPEQVGLPGTGFGAGHNGGMGPAGQEDPHQGQDEAQDEFGEPVPDFPFGNPAAAGSCLGVVRVGLI